MQESDLLAAVRLAGHSHLGADRDTTPKHGHQNRTSGT